MSGRKHRLVASSTARVGSFRWPEEGERRGVNGRASLQRFSNGPRRSQQQQHKQDVQPERKRLRPGDGHVHHRAT
jgi:hypothetical protein